MILYVDSSVLLRLVLRQPGALKEPPRTERTISSVVTRLECFRTLDRLRLKMALLDTITARNGEELQRHLDSLELIALTDEVLGQAARPMPTALGSLDSIHLASALLWQQSQSRPVVMATHDRQLALAARALGLPVVGANT